ncbi:MAG: carboxymuconolactone decarboxylase family protein [Alphaproteobacteria bacterium]|nr:carboxymuconolactone decarboxylase family protein [Alphaproteobacteria bacterium]
MARLPYLNPDDLAPEHKHLLSRNINLLRVLSHNPEAATAFHGVGMYIRHHSKFDPRLRELAILQVGWLARSPYEWSHHVKISYDFGVTDADIQALIDDTADKPTALEPAAKLVLRAAREVTQNLAMSDATYAALAKSYDAALLIDLTLTIGFYNAVVRILATLQIDVEPDYQPYLDKYPLPK